MKYILYAILFLVVVGWLFGGGDDQVDSSSQSLAEKAEEKRKGFHCLSAWDGSHSSFKRAVKEKMRDPGSFEHVATSVTPVSSDGTHTIFMDFRARNGFGGMNVGTALGTFKNSDCSFTVIAVE